MRIFYRMPDWLRWVLLIPSVVVIPIIAGILFYIVLLITGSVGDFGSFSGTISSLFISGFTAYMIIYIASEIAPKGSFIVGLIFGLLLIIFWLIMLIDIIVQLFNYEIVFKIVYILTPLVWIGTSIYAIKKVRYK